MSKIPQQIVPRAVERLAESLARDGFTLTEERYDHDVFGNALMTFAADRLLIRIVRDRSEWGVLVSTGGWDQRHWFPPESWQEYLHDVAPVQPRGAIDDQAELTLSLLPRIQEAVDQNPGEALDFLLERQRKRFDQARRRPNLPSDHD